MYLSSYQRAESIELEILREKKILGKTSVSNAKQICETCRVGGSIFNAEFSLSIFSLAAVLCSGFSLCKVKSILEFLFWCIKLRLVSRPNFAKSRAV